MNFYSNMLGRHVVYNGETGSVVCVYLNQDFIPKVCITIGGLIMDIPLVDVQIVL